MFGAQKKKVSKITCSVHVDTPLWFNFQLPAYLYSVSKKKLKKTRFNPKSLKIENKNEELLSVDGSIFIFLSYGTLVVHIGSGMATAQRSVL